MNMEYTSGSGVVDINMTSAILFVVIASGFLILLYKLMSTWFVVLLVVLFCIGGVEVCILFLLCPLFFCKNNTTDLEVSALHSAIRSVADISVK